MKFVPWWVRIQNIDERTRKLMVDFTKLVEKVAAVETVAASVETIVTEISDELKALRNEGGGALQTQIDGFTARLDAVATALGQAAQTGTAAEGETPAPPTSDEVLAGAAGQAADALKAQDEQVPQ